MMIIDGTLMVFSLCFGFTVGMMMGITITLFLTHYKTAKRRVEFLQWMFRNRERIAKMWKKDEN